MNINICLHPKVVRNRYTGEEVTVRCGKCEYCRNLKASQWVQRLECESKCWKFTYFFTLTFSDKFVHWLEYDSDLDALIDRDSFCGEVNDNDYSHDYLPLKVLSTAGLLNKKTVNYIYQRKRIPYATVRDSQLFIKRLRYAFKKYVPENPSFRYYSVLEYGETTFRPHFHGILWFNSSEAARNIEKMLSEAWSIGKKGQKNKENETLGLIDVSPVVSNAASYVARYVNSLTNLPKIYQFETLRPFATFSRRPAIGTLLFITSEIRKIFDSAASQITIYNAKRSKYESFPLWRSIEGRLFPKLPKYYSLTCTDGVQLYDVFLSTYRAKFRDFVRCLDAFLFDLSKRDTEFSRRIRQYFTDVNYYSKDTLSGLYHFYLSCSRIFYQSIIFGVSAHYYINQIFKYYDNKSKDSLTVFCQFQEDYSKLHKDLKPLMMMDEIFYRHLRSHSSIDSYSDFELGICDLFDVYNKDSFNITLPESTDNLDYYDMSFLSKRIFRASLKTKKKNDYIRRRRFDFNYKWLFKI